MMTVEKKGSKRRSGRRGPEADVPVPFLEHASVHAPQAARAYRLAFYSMVPGVGLVLGPLAALLGWRVLRRGRSSPDFRGGPLCGVAIVLGVLVTITQWAGLALMILASAGG
jgi:hypothetical protein